MKLAEVMSRSCGAGEVERLDDRGFDGDDAILVLQRAFDDEERVVHDGGVIFLEELRLDDDVRDASFVFEAQKDKTFCGAGALANNDGACHADKCAVTKRGETRRRQNSAAVEFRAMMRHRMVANGETGTVKIGDQTFFVIHRIERREKGSGTRVFCCDIVREEFTCGTSGSLDLPQSAAAMNVRFA
jgi:hypothetical protein